jgi:ABC-type transport system involved in multi-copper enzyme maturation permease subunit
MNHYLEYMLARDIKKAFSIRAVFIWICMSALCIFFFFTSDGKRQLMQNNTVEFMTLMLPQIIFGSWAVLSVYFDIISADREHNVLDMILCSGTAKGSVFLSKILTMMVISLILSVMYLLPITAIIIGLSAQPDYISLFFQYLIPLWGYVMVYATLGLVISVTARSSKAAMIWSLAGGLILMPRFFMIVVDGLSSAFGWTEGVKNAVSMISPGVLMNALSDSSNPVRLVQAAVGFSVGIIALALLSFLVFRKQDELNYGQ